MSHEGLYHVNLECGVFPPQMFVPSLIGDWWFPLLFLVRFDHICDTYPYEIHFLVYIMPQVEATLFPPAAI
jgi:hypothetical protein